MKTPRPADILYQPPEVVRLLLNDDAPEQERQQKAHPARVALLCDWCWHPMTEHGIWGCDDLACECTAENHEC